MSEKPQDQVKEIRAVVRDPTTVKEGTFSDDRVKLVAGDVTNSEDLNKYFEGA